MTILSTSSFVALVLMLGTSVGVTDMYDLKTVVNGLRWNRVDIVGDRLFERRLVSWFKEVYKIGTAFKAMEMDQSVCSNKTPYPLIIVSSLTTLTRDLDCATKRQPYKSLVILQQRVLMR